MKENALKEALRLYKMGAAIHLLHPKSKVPIDFGWTSGPRKSWKEIKSQYQPGMNLGVRLGSASQIGGRGFLAAVDLDIKSKLPAHREEAERAAAQVVRELKQFPTVGSGRGLGSRHYYGITREPFKTWNPAASSDYVKAFIPSKKPSKRDLEKLSESEIKAGYRISRAWEVSLYSEGRQIVLPPSIHPDTGKPYVWEQDWETPEQLPYLEITKEEVTTTTPVRREKGKSTAKLAPSSLESESFTLSRVNLDWVEMSPEMRRSITHGEGVSDRSAFLLPASKALLRAGLSQDEVLSILTERTYFLGQCAFDHAQTEDRERAARWVWRYTLKKVMEENDGAQIFKPVQPGSSSRKIILTKEEEKKQSLEIESSVLSSWEAELKRSPSRNGELGKILNTFNNLCLILSNEVAQPLFIKDEFLNRETYGIDAPWGAKKGKQLTDVDPLNIKLWMSQGRFAYEPPTQMIIDAIQVITEKNTHHPVRDWLSSLKWDGQPRISTWIKTYLKGQAPEPYLSDISRNFLIAMVKRVFEPGCQWDYTLILEGVQGNRKSTTARVLAGEAWFCDHLPDLRDKDAMLNLQGAWVVEIGELKSIKHSDSATVKAFLTKRVDRVRAPYARRWVDAPRQNVFIGTVNENEYFKDPTGNRRFWPVQVGDCDTDALSRDRDQLFAEAVHHYSGGYRELYLKGESAKQAAEEQESKRVEDDIFEMKEELSVFMERGENKNIDLNRFRIRELFVSPGAPWKRWADKAYAVQNGAQVLHSLGFKKIRTKNERLWGKNNKNKDCTGGRKWVTEGDRGVTEG